MKKILVPTDFSDNASAAMRYALQLNEKMSAEIIFMHALDPLMRTDLPKAEYEKEVEHYKKEAQNQLIAQIRAVFTQLGRAADAENAKFVVRSEDNAIQDILQTATDLAIDLIIMGTVGATGLKKLLFGSNTTQIIRRATCPVLSVPANYDFQPIHKIGYASDLTQPLPELRSVLPFASLLGATIEVFHVYPVYPQYVDVKTFDNEGVLQEWKKDLQYDKINLHFVHTENDNDVDAGIELYRQSYKPDCMAMFRHDRNFFDTLLDISFTDNYAFQPSVPLLSLKV
ncbi:MAG: universal stress protein [Cytophagales bacterium]|nr:MAG: universal stress protein [Cytophagales bacterium]